VPGSSRHPRRMWRRTPARHQQGGGELPILDTRRVGPTGTRWNADQLAGRPRHVAYDRKGGSRRQPRMRRWRRGHDGRGARQRRGRVRRLLTLRADGNLPFSLPRLRIRADRGGHGASAPFAGHRDRLLRHAGRAGGRRTMSTQVSAGQDPAERWCWQKANSRSTVYRANYWTTSRSRSAAGRPGRPGGTEVTGEFGPGPLTSHARTSRPSAASPAVASWPRSWTAGCGGQPRRGKDMSRTRGPTRASAVEMFGGRARPDRVGVLTAEQRKQSPGCSAPGPVRAGTVLPGVPAEDRYTTRVRLRAQGILRSAARDSVDTHTVGDRPGRRTCGPG